MRDLSELGIRPRRRNPYPPATAPQIADFEKHFGFKIPAAYSNFLRFANGGLPTLSCYDNPPGGRGEVNDFYGLGSKATDDDAALQNDSYWDVGNLWGETRRLQPVLGAGTLPFARDGGDNQLFLDLSKPVAPVMRIYSATRLRYQVAESFESFIDMLYLPHYERPRGDNKYKK